MGSAFASNGAPNSQPASAEADAHGFAAVLAGAVAPQVHMAAPTRAPKAKSEIGTDSDSERTGATTTGESDSAKSTDPERAAALGAAATGLNPALKSKLTRVIERMHSEFGRDVRLVEGVRSQERQNQLFSQGRDAIGPVVTWTRNSLHSVGRAADLVINGGYDDATGFALLRQVAEEEGLHTLGPKDPGHIELRGASSPVTPTLADTLRSTVTPAGSNPRENLIVATPSMGRIATPGAVASVATVARVASVARVAQVGAAVAGVAARNVGPAVTIKADASATPVTGPAGTSTSGDSTTSGDTSSGTGSGKQDAGLRREAHAGNRVEHGINGLAADAYRALDGSRDANGLADNSTSDALHDASASTASRAARAMDAQDAPGPRSLSHLTLSLDDGHGGQDQVRVGMRGSSVGASFDMSNTISADRVSSRLGELTRALEQRGLEPQSFQVRASSTSRDTDAARVSTAAPGAPRAVSDAAAMRNDAQSAFAGDGRQRFSHRNDQQEQAQQRQNEQRRRSYSFSLTPEES